MRNERRGTFFFPRSALANLEGSFPRGSSGLCVG